MPLDRERQGMSLSEFKQRLNNDTYSLRVGKEVPEGDVNLAYMHVPKVHVDENVSLIHTTSVSDNIIAHDQMNSIVAANEEGKLEYVDLIGNNELQTRAPETTFPSRRISLTREFKRNNYDIQNALYYQFTLQYHYDSKARTPGKRQKYDGQQIELTDENGNILSDDFPYEIYVTPEMNNPRICFVEIYMNMKTNENETYMVRYNHIDEVRPDHEIQSVQKSIQLYSNTINRVLVDGINKAMMEGGKLRVINSSSAFQEASVDDVINEQQGDQVASIYSIQERIDKDGYEIIVPQKAEADPRNKRIFSYRIVASFINDEGNVQKFSTGYMTDWTINPEALLKKELGEYSKEWKNIGIPTGTNRLTVPEMIRKSLPPGMELGVNVLSYEVQDDLGNVLYTHKGNNDYNQIQSHINPNMQDIVEAKALGLNESAWIVAEQDNTMLKNNRIPHRCSIIAETQRTFWNFTWSVVGRGKLIEFKDDKGRAWATEEWREIKGSGTLTYNLDGTFTSKITPYRLPNREIKDLGVVDLVWDTPIITSGDQVRPHVERDYIRASIDGVPDIEMIGVPYTIEEDKILKNEGIKYLNQIFGVDGIYEKLKIPANIQMKDVMLRIERGKVFPDGTPDVGTMDFRINYRFICSKNGNERFPVDQVNDELGVNRIRLAYLVDKDGKLYDDLSLELAAWTTFEDLEAVPIYGIQVEEDRKLEIAMPQVEESRMETENWYLRIKNGRIYKTIELPYFNELSEIVPQIYVSYPSLKRLMPNPGERREVELEYTLPEYDNQEFYDQPKVLIERENPIILNEYTIQTKHYPIALDATGEGGYIQINAIRGNDTRNLEISDIDAEKGIIYLLDRIREQDDVTVRYVYNEEWYTYKGFERTNQEYYHLDLNPTPGHMHTILENGFHQWVPIDIDSESGKIKEVSNQYLLVKQINIYMRPNCIRHKDAKRAKIEGTDKIQTIYHTDEDHWFNPKDAKYDPTMLRLGKVIVHANSNIQDNLTILDTRTRGGGLDESLNKEVIKRVNEESMYHWDIGYFDGEAYQENGVMIIRLPNTLLEQFSKSQIEAAIAKHKAYGNLPIIEYYDPEKITSSRFGILSQFDFDKGEHLTYYDPNLTTNASIVPDSRSDSHNYVLKLKDNNVYGMTIPHYAIEDMSGIQINIKCFRDTNAVIRKAGVVTVIYEDGEKETIDLPMVTYGGMWQPIEQAIDFTENKEVERIQLVLNDPSSSTRGEILFDYVEIKAYQEFDEENAEIHEI